MSAIAAVVIIFILKWGCGIEQGKKFLHDHTADIEDTGMLQQANQMHIQLAYPLYFIIEAETRWRAC